MSTENLNLLLAAVTVVLAILAVIVAIQTLRYMRGRDLEVDTRNGWIEIHKAMVNLRVQRSLVMLPSVMGGYSAAVTSSADAISNYTLANSQLIGQLDRLNDDPLLEKISEFLNANLLTKDWQTPQYQTEFDKFAKQVALKARPK